MFATRRSGVVHILAIVLVAGVSLAAEDPAAPAERNGQVTTIGQRQTGPDAALPHGASPGSISLWFVRPPGVSNKVLFVYGSPVQGKARGLWLERDDQLCFYFWGWPDDLKAKVAGRVTANRWHHVVGTYDGTTARLFYDGRLLKSVETKIDTAPGGRFLVGKNLANDGRDFPGKIENVAIFHRALTAKEIGDLFAKDAGTRSEFRVASPAEDLDSGLNGDLEEGDLEEIVFAVRQADTDGHWYANFGYNIINPDRRYYHDGGRLCRLNVKTGEVITPIDDPQGGVRDPQVHYDGRKVLFSYRKGGQPYYHLYEINIDGSGLRQLTGGPYDDFEPTYLPDGNIIFCSSRCNRWVPCYFTQVAVLYRCDAGGGNIRQLSANTEQENTPWVLPDGRILYQRWEYVDRSQIGYHHLWTMNPDGSGQTVFFGNMHPNVVMIDAKPIAGTEKVVASFAPGHGRNEHAGAITVVNPRLGPDALEMARPISRGGLYRDPYPLSEHLFLVAGKTEILLMDDRGNKKPVYDLPADWRKGRMLVHEPRPLRPRRRERVLPSRIDLPQETGRVIVEDVYSGRNMEGVRRGEIKKLLVLEILPKPYNMFSGMEPLSYGGTFLLERVLGTVPVEPDGSVHVELPAMRPLFFVTLDGDGMSVKRMQSFMTVQPGEQVSCIGCHEQRVQTPGARTPRAGAPLLASHRPPSKIEPIAGVPDVLDFPRDVQPILDKHCVACHDYDRSGGDGPMAGGVILSGDRGPMFSHSYYMLTICAQFADGRNLRKSNYPPRAIGSSASLLMNKLGPEHYDVTLSDHEKQVIRLWIDSGAAYPGTYAALGTGMIGHYSSGGIDRQDLRWPSVENAREVLRRRCIGCHKGAISLPDSPSDNRRLVPWAEGAMNDLARRTSQRNNPVFRFSRHALYNLSRPEKSLQLLAPLSKDGGGYGICKAAGDSTGDGESKPAVVFSSTSDPDYQVLLSAIRSAKEHLDEIKRFDMPDFRPSPHYVREMKRYGILPSDMGPDEPIDVYRADREYWESFWHLPGEARSESK